MSVPPSAPLPDLSLLEAIFAPYMGLYNEAARWFVRGLLSDAGAAPNTYRAQTFPAFPWRAVAMDGSALLAIDRRDPNRQVNLHGTPVEMAAQLYALEPYGVRPAILDGQTWLFSNGQSALVAQSRWGRSKGYAHLAGEGLIRLEEEGPPTWHPPRWVGDPPVPLVLLAGPSPWGRDVPWVDWAAWKTRSETLAVHLGRVASTAEVVPIEINLNHVPKDPRL